MTFLAGTFIFDNRKKQERRHLWLAATGVSKEDIQDHWEQFAISSWNSLMTISVLCCNYFEEIGADITCAIVSVYCVDGILIVTAVVITLILFFHWDTFQGFIILFIYNAFLVILSIKISSTLSNRPCFLSITESPGNSAGRSSMVWVIAS